MQDPSSENPELRLQRDGDIGFVIASNPARMNAFTAGMWRALPEVLAAAEADPAIRVIVLRGAGTRAFSAGADISEFDSARSGDATTAYDALNDAAFRALSGCTKPTIAMIHGFCLGGGLAIALCTDIRIADEAELLSTPRLANSPAFGPAECFRIATQQRDRPVASRSAIGQPKPL